MNIVDGPAKVTQLIKNCITSEMVEDGLLEEVNQFVPSYRFDEEVEEPFIGLFEHETTPAINGTLSHKIEMQTPFEFICIVYDDEDLEKSEIKGKTLACKVAASIAKNFTRVTVNGEVIPVLKPVLESIQPIGLVEVVDKSDTAVATSVRISIHYYIDWMACYKKNNNNNGD